MPTQIYQPEYLPDTLFTIGQVVVSIETDDRRSYIIDDFCYSVKDDEWSVKYHSINKPKAEFVDLLYYFNTMFQVKEDSNE